MLGPQAPATPAGRAAVDTIVEHIGRLHDAEITDRERRLGVLRPHDLRHTFGYRL